MEGRENEWEGIGKVGEVVSGPLTQKKWNVVNVISYDVVNFISCALRLLNKCLWISFSDFVMILIASICG